jgi:hypothetical protein
MTAPLTSPEGQRTLFAVASGGANTLVAVLAAIAITGEFRHKTATATFLATRGVAGSWPRSSRPSPWSELPTGPPV